MDLTIGTQLETFLQPCLGICFGAMFGAGTLPQANYIELYGEHVACLELQDGGSPVDQAFENGKAALKLGFERRWFLQRRESPLGNLMVFVGSMGSVIFTYIYCK